MGAYIRLRNNFFFSTYIGLYPGAFNGGKGVNLGFYGIYKFTGI